MQYNRQKLIGVLLDHEGEVLKPYRCSAGYLTIGVGRNLDAKGISRDESRFLLNNDIDQVHEEIVRNLPWFYNLNPDRQLVLMDMAFNLGTNGLLQFKRTLRAIEEGRFDDASEHMLDSKWAKQVGRRAIFLAKVMRDGVAE